MTAVLTNKAQGIASAGPGESSLSSLESLRVPKQESPAAADPVTQRVAQELGMKARTLFNTLSQFADHKDSDLHRAASLVHKEATKVLSGLLRSGASEASAQALELTKSLSEHQKGLKATFGQEKLAKHDDLSSLTLPKIKIG